jgi:predicted negative regulator of RcsB-dependent stress response
MARREHGTAAEMLDEIESAADQLSEWLQTHFVAVGGAIVALLAAGGLVAWITSSRSDAEEQASAALAKTRADYLSAMGAPPGSYEVPELANADAAKQIREEYDQRYAEVETKHAGTVAGALASIERAELMSASGRDDVAITQLEHALTEAPAHGGVRGLIEQRLAQRLEAAGRWADAANHHEAASKLADYPLREWALADAARCRAAAGDGDAARALYDRLDKEAPDLQLSEAQAAQKLELRARAE